MAASSKGIQEEIFQQIILDVSVWYDQRPYINLLKVLYRDHVANIFELDNASKTMDLLNLLIDLGDLSANNLTLIYDTIKATKQFGLIEKVKALIPSCPNVRETRIKNFSHYRQRLVMLGMVLRQVDMAKISELYNDPVKEYTDGWNLIMDLEHRLIFCEGRIEAFIEDLRKLQLPLAVEALTKGNREASSTSSTSSKKASLDNVVNHFKRSVSNPNDGTSYRQLVKPPDNGSVSNPNDGTSYRQLVKPPDNENPINLTAKDLTFKRLLESSKHENPINLTAKDPTFKKLLESSKHENPSTSNPTNEKIAFKELLKSSLKRKVESSKLAKRSKLHREGAIGSSDSEELSAVNSDDETNTLLVKPELYHRYVETSTDLVIASSDSSDWSDYSDDERETDPAKSEKALKKALVKESMPKTVEGTSKQFKTSVKLEVGSSGESFQNLELLSLVSTHSASATSVKSEIANWLNPKRQDGSYVEIIEQPKQREFRFRYQVEGRSASISGERSISKKKSFPTIKISNYKGCVRILVSLVTNETGTAKPRPHPYGLVGKDCENGVCKKFVSRADQPITFENLGIQRIKQKEIFSALLVRLNHGIDPYKNCKLTTTDRKKLAGQYDLSVVCLCFQVFTAKKDSPDDPDIPLEPVVSQPIFDKNFPALEMLRIDRRRGYACGGDKIFILCSKIQRDDISVKFYDADWSDHARFGPADIHRQVAIVCRTPPYKDVNITEPKRVYFKLVRPSDKDGSLSVQFTYLPNKKRSKVFIKKS